MRRRLAPVLVLAVIASFTVASATAGGAPTCGSTPPPEVAAEEDGWPLANRDYRNSRAQFDSEIEASTIDQLERAWEYPVPGDRLFGNLATNPVVADGRVYVGALDGSTHAVDLATGTRDWAVERSLPQFGPSGVAVGWGKVFGISGTATVVAQDADTGASLWTKNLSLAPGNQIDMQPTVIGDCVFIATQGLAGGSRGTLYALDQATGAVVWSFDTVPDDFWGNTRVNHGGGSWYPPTIDPSAGRVWWGTSNPWPAPGTPGFPAGSSRPGDNLYTNSAIAFDLGDGTMEWYDQAFQHDIFDRDMVLTQLVDVGNDEVLVHTGKGAVVRGLDPDDGTVRWETPVGMHQNDELTDFVGALTVLPGVLGGVETPPSAADGVVYLAVLNAPSTYSGPDQTFNLNAQLGTYPSNLVAVDAATGEVVFDVDLPGDGLGATTVVNDLVLTSTFDGLLLAYDRFTGEEVWRHQADGFVNGSPAVVGNLVIWPVSGSAPGELLAFRLPAQPPPTTTTTSTTTVGPAGPTTTTPLIPSTTVPPGVRANELESTPGRPVPGSPRFTG